MLHNKGTVSLETERLRLRCFSESDAEYMYKNWASSSQVTKYLTWFPHKSVEETKEVINGWISEYSKPHTYRWAIELKKIGEPIGSVFVAWMNEEKLSCEVGCCLGEAFWNKGYATEVLDAVLAFLFEEVGFCRITACHDVRNPNSGKVMEKSGMRYEGTFREIGRTKEGDRLTLSFYSALRREWLLTRKESLGGLDKKKPNFFEIRQKIFDMSFENFIVNETNEKAYRKMKNAADHFFVEEEAILLSGPEQSGKTHLIEATLEALLRKDYSLGIRHIQTEDFVNRIVDFQVSMGKDAQQKGVEPYLCLCADCDVLVFEDIHFLKDKRFSINAFLQLLRMAQEKGCKILISSDANYLQNSNETIKEATSRFIKIGIEEQNEDLLRKCLEKDKAAFGIPTVEFSDMKDCRNIQMLKSRLVKMAKEEWRIIKELSFERPKSNPNFILTLYAGKKEGYRWEIDWEMLEKDEEKRRKVAYKLYTRSGLSRKEISGILNYSQSQVDEDIHIWENTVEEFPFLNAIEDHMEEMYERCRPMSSNL